MRPDAELPDEYLIGHIEDALARDPRVAEHGLRAHLIGDPPTVVVTGTVTHAGQKAGIIEILRELWPGLRVRDDSMVADYPESGEVEVLP